MGQSATYCRNVLYIILHVIYIYRWHLCWLLISSDWRSYSYDEPGLVPLFESWGHLGDILWSSWRHFGHTYWHIVGIMMMMLIMAYNDGVMMFLSQFCCGLVGQRSGAVSHCKGISLQADHASNFHTSTAPRDGITTFFYLLPTFIAKHTDTWTCGSQNISLQMDDGR